MGIQIILTWRITWGELRILNKTTNVSMEPRVSFGYITWWFKVYPGHIGMDEDDEEEGDEATSEELLENDPYQVNNLIHDILMLEGEVLGVPSLVILPIVVPLATPGKRL